MAPPRSVTTVPQQARLIPGLLLNEVSKMGFGPNEYMLVVITLAFALLMFGRI